MFLANTLFGVAGCEARECRSIYSPERISHAQARRGSMHSRAPSL